MKKLPIATLLLSISICQAAIPLSDEAHNSQATSASDAHITFNKNAWQDANTEQAVNNLLRKALFQELQEKNKKKLEQQQKDNAVKGCLNGLASLVGICIASACNHLKGEAKETNTNQTLFIAGITGAVAGGILAANAALDWWQAKKKLEAKPEAQSD